MIMKEISPLCIFRIGPNRFLNITKKDHFTKPQLATPLTPSHNSLYFIHGLLQKFPTSHKELSDLQPYNKNDISEAAELGESQCWP